MSVAVCLSNFTPSDGASGPIGPIHNAGMRQLGADADLPCQTHPDKRVKCACIETESEKRLKTHPIQHLVSRKQLNLLSRPCESHNRLRTQPAASRMELTGYKGQTSNYAA
jgi:hypothetical protein